MPRMACHGCSSLKYVQCEGPLSFWNMSFWLRCHIKICMSFPCLSCEGYTSPTKVAGMHCLSATMHAFFRWAGTPAVTRSLFKALKCLSHSEDHGQMDLKTPSMDGISHGSWILTTSDWWFQSPFKEGKHSGIIIPSGHDISGLSKTFQNHQPKGVMSSCMRHVQTNSLISLLRPFSKSAVTVSNEVFRCDPGTRRQWKW